MPSICFYFEVHQPFRLKNYSVFEVTNDHNYFDESLNKEIFLKVANKCYLPTNQIWLDLLNQYPELKISFSMSGVFMEQAKLYCPEVIESFQRLVATNRVEILAETYYHSLSGLYSKDEFVAQIKKHGECVQELFGVKPTVFRNTELIYSEDLGLKVANLGYLGMLTEGVDRILAGRSPNQLYSNQTNNLKLLLKNYNLSDDIAFRFSDPNWVEHPLTAEKFTTWVNQINGGGEIVNLFMDYETFGEHQWIESGIFEFLKALPGQILNNHSNSFITPSEAIKNLVSRDTYFSSDYISWADQERDLSAWRSNPMQNDALDKIFGFENRVKNTLDLQIIEDWRRLTTSDHFYYMCTKYFSDGDVHKYFSPYPSPYIAFINFVNCLKDLEYRIRMVEK